MEIRERQAALCVFRRGDEFLIVEITDSQNGNVLHRPPGGGIEAGETPEQAVRRELLEELAITLGEVRLLGAIDHEWQWKGHINRERAWVFAGDPADDARLSGPIGPELLEADGDRFPTLWRKLTDYSSALPPLCPAGLLELLKETT